MSKRSKLLGALGALAIVGVIGAGALYYFVIRNDSPEACRSIAPYRPSQRHAGSRQQRHER